MTFLLSSFTQDDMKDSRTGRGYRGQENERSLICLRSYPLRGGKQFFTSTTLKLWCIHIGFCLKKSLYLWGDNLSWKTNSLKTCYLKIHLSNIVVSASQ